MKQQIAVFDYAQHILQALKTGVLLTVKAGEVQVLEGQLFRDGVDGSLSSHHGVLAAVL